MVRRVSLGWLPVWLAALSSVGCDAPAAPSPPDASEAVDAGTDADRSDTGGVDAGPRLTVVSAMEVGVVAMSPSVQGRDGGDSARLWGRTIFAYGDTFLNAPDAMGSQLHGNSFAFTTDTDASDGIAPIDDRHDATGAPVFYVPPTDDEAAFNAAHAGDPCAVMPCNARWAVWAGAPIWDEAHARGIVLYQLIYAEPGSFNFHSVGGSVAFWSSFDAVPERPVVDAAAEHPTLVFGEGEPAPTGGGQIVGDELWAFSCEGARCGLMSVPLDGLLERAAWRYWDGSAWSASSADMSQVISAASILTVRYDAYVGGFIAVYAAPLSRNVMLRTAPDLRGPWSPATRLFVADTHGMSDAAYDANEHVAFEEDHGRVIYVTYSRPTPLAWFSDEMALWRVELGRTP